MDKMELIREYHYQLTLLGRMNGMGLLKYRQTMGVSIRGGNFLRIDTMKMQKMIELAGYYYFRGTGSDRDIATSLYVELANRIKAQQWYYSVDVTDFQLNRSYDGLKHLVDKTMQGHNVHAYINEENLIGATPQAIGMVTHETIKRQMTDKEDENMEGYLKGMKTVGVKFNSSHTMSFTGAGDPNKIYHFRTADESLKIGDEVLVMTKRGYNVAVVATELGDEKIADMMVISKLDTKSITSAKEKFEKKAELMSKMEARAKQLEKTDKFRVYAEADEEMKKLYEEFNRV